MQSDQSIEESQESCSEKSESQKQQVEPEKLNEAQLKKLESQLLSLRCKINDKQSRQDMYAKLLAKVQYGQRLDIILSIMKEIRAELAQLKEDYREKAGKNKRKLIRKNKKQQK